MRIIVCLLVIEYRACHEALGHTQAISGDASVFDTFVTRHGVIGRWRT